jgi:hypothetical protein
MKKVFRETECENVCVCVCVFFFFLPPPTISGDCVVSNDAMIGEHELERFQKEGIMFY